MSIVSPSGEKLIDLCRELKARSAGLDTSGEWPAEQLRLCGQYGVYQWFLEPAWGGQAWNETDVVQGYLALSAACLTTTFIITQRTGACRRIAACGNESLKSRLLPPLARGDTFATVGISHLTTSRRHLRHPVLTAERTREGYILNGYSPWVTGAQAAESIVLGAQLVEAGEPTDKQLLFALPTNVAGVRIDPPAQLVGLSASHTGPAQLDQVHVSDEWLIAGPAENVMASGLGAATGGHETSTLAVGLAGAAIDFLGEQAERRAELSAPYRALQAEREQVLADLLAIAAGDSPCTREVLRSRANSLVLRATQASLSAAKGTGYVVGHPAGRWCREALFFLVWSCPQPVANRNLCELAGIESLGNY
jgi:alkylation response protein AidB-like acyl-CoA dehydrogenase